MAKLIKCTATLDWDQKCPRCGESARDKKSFYEAWGKFRCECGKTFKPEFVEPRVADARKIEIDPSKVVNGKIERICACGCGEKFWPRVADVKRGWGLFVNKSHKAIEQERRTGQYHGRGDDNGYKEREENRQWEEESDIHPVGYGHIFADGDAGHGQH